MSERGRQGRKRYFPPGLRELWRGLACPSRISFSTSCSLWKHVSFPWPGKQPFSRPNTSHSKAWPGNQPFFRPNASRSTALAGKSAFFPAERLSQHCSAGKSAFFPAEHFAQHCSGRENPGFGGWAGRISQRAAFSCISDGKNLLLPFSLSSELCLKRDCYLAMRRWPSEHCTLDCPVCMLIRELRPPKLQNIYSTALSRRNAGFTAAGARTKKLLWRLRSACPTPASARWCV